MELLVVMAELEEEAGNISVSKSANVYAYNGNECSLPKDDANYYNKPLEIYAQRGILREVYKVNVAWGIRDNYSYEYFLDLFGEDTIGDDVKNTSLATVDSDVRNVLVRKRIENDNLKSGYVNKKNNSIFGVGSGAGYIELSNGSYTEFD